MASTGRYKVAKRRGILSMKPITLTWTTLCHTASTAVLSFSMVCAGGATALSSATHVRWGATHVPRESCRVWKNIDFVHAVKNSPCGVAGIVLLEQQVRRSLHPWPNYNQNNLLMYCSNVKLPAMCTRAVRCLNMMPLQTIILVGERFNTRRYGLSCGVILEAITLVHGRHSPIKKWDSSANNTRLHSLVQLR